MIKIGLDKKKSHSILNWLNQVRIKPNLKLVYSNDIF